MARAILKIWRVIGVLRVRRALPSREFMESAMTEGRRFKQDRSLHDRLESEAQRLREQARVLPSGAQRLHLLNRIEKFDRAISINRWLSSPAHKLSNATTSPRFEAVGR